VPFEADLNTRIIPKDREVYVARPGRSYRLYREIVKDRVVVADLPFLDFKKGVPIRKQLNLDARILRSRALRSWYRRKRVGDTPSRDLDDYVGKTDRSVHQLRGILLGYFEKLKIDDLVIVPPSAYSQQAMVGEVTGAAEAYIRVRVPRLYGGDPLTGRRVTWLAGIEKRRLPTPILDTLEKPNALFLLARQLRPTIYETAFGAFVDLSTREPDYIARFDVKNKNYTTSSDIFLQTFFNAVASNQKAIDSGKATKGFREAAFEDLGIYAPELRTNVNSPGFLTLVSKKTTPLVASALLALAVNIGADAPTLAQEGKITLGNSQAPAGDECTASVWKDTLDQLKLLGLAKEWPQACEIAKLATEKSGVTGAVKVRPQR
jgi:hypothetical protein